MKRVLLFLLTMYCAFSTLNLSAQSLARQWNEAIITGIRNDFARPPMNARNLYHYNLAMYDAWAVYDDTATTVLLGKTIGNFSSPFNGVETPVNVAQRQAFQDAAISYACYRMMLNRYPNSPGWLGITFPLITNLMNENGYDPAFVSTDYTTGDPRAMGNYIAAQVIAYGMQDGSNQSVNYSNLYYNPINPALFPTLPGTGGIINPNRWQPISVSVYVDQNGNLLSGAPPFIGAEWGNVQPFAMDDNDKEVLMRDGFPWTVYHNPGPFPSILPGGCLDDEYKWNFALVAKWSGHLDPSDTTLVDCSPAAMGNIDSLPDNFEEAQAFYNFMEGGDNGTGRTINPITGLPYESQWVKRGDYARILAEFWADGPNSETPPGHWFTILNYVMDQLNGQYRWQGTGPVLEEQEYCVKSYLTLAGAMHDAAIAAWGIKGYYDGVRPISAIRYMATNGQCTDPNLPHYNVKGFPLIDGFSELVMPGDTLEGANQENLYKVKIKAWKGPEVITDPTSQTAGVDWILAEKWYPYQRPSFVTPPFAGYVSGHSTYSRAAADVLTHITGSSYFPNGMGVFSAPANEYLVFEDGPTQDIQLQWATYQDASDQCSLSRIWGGIHPPFDDIPGRKIGTVVAEESSQKAETYFVDHSPRVAQIISPTVINDASVFTGWQVSAVYDRVMDTTITPLLQFTATSPYADAVFVNGLWQDDSTYVWNFDVLDNNVEWSGLNVKITGGKDTTNQLQRVFSAYDILNWDTREPLVTGLTSSSSLVNQSAVGTNAWNAIVVFDQPLDTTTLPVISGLPSSFVVNNYTWISDSIFQVYFDVLDNDEEVGPINVLSWGAMDGNGNLQAQYISGNLLLVDTKTPVANFTANYYTLTAAQGGLSIFHVLLHFDETMNTGVSPVLSWVNPSASNALFMASSVWMNDSTYQVNYNVNNNSINLSDVDLLVSQAKDIHANTMENAAWLDTLNIWFVPWVSGCMDTSACNFDPQANLEGTCHYTGDTCDDGDPNTENDVLQFDCSCSGVSGVEEWTQSVSLYPNPSSSFVHFSQGGYWTCYDVTGRVVMQGKFSADTPVDVTALSSGFYVWRRAEQTLRWRKW